MVSGKQVVADVGGDLKLESLQDSSSYASRNQSAGGSLTISPAGVPIGGGLNAGQSKVDVYTPIGTNPTSIARAIEGKNSQATAAIVQTSIADADMATVAARTWGKPTARNIQTIFFQKSD